jgi:hypothetical protein
MSERLAVIKKHDAVSTGAVSRRQLGARMNVMHLPDVSASRKLKLITDLGARGKVFQHQKHREYSLLHMHRRVLR